MSAPPDSFEAFVSAARLAVELEAERHADDLWWILEPVLLVQRRDLRLETVALTPDVAEEPTGRALLQADLTSLPKALHARRCAIALHVDLLLGDGDEIQPAIVLAVVGALAASLQRARVERTPTGTPRLGPWEPSQELADDLMHALRQLLAPRS